jgi:hypothetical protein
VDILVDLDVLDLYISIADIADVEIVVSCINIGPDSMVSTLV